MKDEFLIQDLIFNINIGSAQTYNSPFAHHLQQSDVWKAFH